MPAANGNQQHQGVDEATEHAVHLRQATPGHRYADADIFLAAVAVQQALPGRQQQGKQRGVFPLGQGTQLAGQAFTTRFFCCEKQKKELKHAAQSGAQFGTQNQGFS